MEDVKKKYCVTSWDYHGHHSTNNFEAESLKEAEKVFWKEHSYSYGETTLYACPKGWDTWNHKGYIELMSEDMYIGYKNRKSIKQRLVCLLGLCMAFMMGYSQTWNVLENEYSLSRAGYDDSTGEVVIPSPVYGSRVIYDYYSHRVDTLYYRDGTVWDSQVFPKAVYDEYNLGSDCLTAGKVTLGIGVPLAVIGALMAGIPSNSRGVVTAGWVFVGMGCALVTVSVPLFCWGDHMRREANWNYTLFGY